jgi:hypothetical protein
MSHDSDSRSAIYVLWTLLLLALTIETTSAWLTRLPSLTLAEPRSNIAAAAAGDLFLFAGGLTANGEVSSRIYIFFLNNFTLNDQLADLDSPLPLY